MSIFRDKMPGRRTVYVLKSADFAIHHDTTSFFFFSTERNEATNAKQFKFHFIISKFSYNTTG